MIVAAVVCLAPGCAAFDRSLAKEVRAGHDFRLVGDDGRCSVWSARPLAPDEGREWMQLLANERKRVEDFFATAMSGRVTLWLVESLPDRFAGDAFAEGKEMFLRLSHGNRPSSGDVTLIAHEMTHVVMSEVFGMVRPFWFEEGLATYIEGQTLGFGAGSRDLLSGATGLSRVDVASLTLENVEAIERPLSYRLSAAAIEIIIEKHGASAIRRLQRESSGRRFAEGYFRVTGESMESLEGRWREEIRTATRLYR